MVVCVDSGWGISKDGKIPWRISEDLKFFKQTTLNSVVIMGRRTFEQVGFLPNRITLVVSNTLSGDYVYKTLQDALNTVKGQTVYVIGGSQLYQEGYINSECDRIYLNVIDHDYNCDNRIDNPEKYGFKLISEDTIPVKDKLNNIDVVLTRKYYSPR